MPLPETMSRSPLPLTLGLRANWVQFSVLVFINAFVGAMVGMERMVLPLIAEQVFALPSTTFALSFLVSFGCVKAVTNLFTGRLVDHFGRKPLSRTGDGIE